MLGYSRGTSEGGYKPLIAACTCAYMQIHMHTHTVTSVWPAFSGISLLISTVNCSHHLSANTEAVWNGSFTLASRKSAEASIYLLICSPQLVLEVDASIVVTLCIHCGPCNYWWECHHAWVHHVVPIEQKVSIILHALNHCLKTIQLQLCLISHLYVSSLCRTAMPRFACSHLVLWK